MGYIHFHKYFEFQRLLGIFIKILQTCLDAIVLTLSSTNFYGFYKCRGGKSSYLIFRALEKTFRNKRGIHEKRNEFHWQHDDEVIVWVKRMNVLSF